MFDAIRQGATLYTVQQRRAWCPKRQAAKRFAKVFRDHEVWVMRNGQGRQGFVAVRRDGYVNLAFVRRPLAGRGILRRLMFAISAAQPGPLSVHASLHAEPAFAAMGFAVRERQAIVRNGQTLRRAFMERDEKGMLSDSKYI